MGNALLILGLPAYPLRFESLPAPAVAALFLLLAVPVIWLGRPTIRWQGPARGWTAIGVRLAAVWVLVLLLAGARWEQRNTDLEVIILRDVSASTASGPHPPRTGVAEAGADLALLAARNKPKNDRIGMIRFDERASIDAFPDTQLRLSTAAVRPGGGGATDIAAGVSLALASFRGDAMRRMLLISDGNANQGDTVAAVSAAVAAGVAVDVMPLKYRIGADVMVERLVAPFYRREGEPYALQVMLRSSNVATVYGSVRVTDGGQPLDLDPLAPGVQATVPVSAHPGATTVNIKLPRAAGGLHTYAAVFETSPDADALAANNVAEAMTFVRGRLRVLYVDHVPGNGGQLLLKALRGEGISVEDVDHVTPERFPGSAVALQNYDAVVLANVPRGFAGLGAEQERALIRYVRDLGGGLLVVGGPDALGAGQWQGSELEKVLPVDMEPRCKRRTPPGALVIVMDRSGSMTDAMGGAARGSKHDAAVGAAVQALLALQPDDLAGVLAFSTGHQWAVPIKHNRDPGIAAAEVRRLRASGGTSIYPALKEALDALEKVPPQQAKLRHILLMTDGVSEWGDYDALLARMERSGITLSTVAVGCDADAPLLAQLAQRGGGCAYAVNDTKRLTDAFVREAHMLRRPLIVEPAGGIPLAADSSAKRLLRGVAESQLPPLMGMVLAAAKSNPSVQVPLRAVGPLDDPVLAHWPSGLGRAAVFTGDATPRWAPQWVKSPVYSKFWAQAVRSVARQPMSEGFELRTVRDGPRTKLVVDVTRPRGEGGGAGDGDAPGAGRAWSFLSIAGKVLAPDAARCQDVRLAQTGPGTYEATLDTRDPGSYFVSLQAQAPSGETGSLWAGTIVASAQELRDLQSNDQLLARIAADTGGRVLAAFDPGANLFSREGLTPSVRSQPLRDLLIVTLLTILLIDVAVRRVSWNRHAVGRWCAARVDAFCATRVIEPVAVVGALCRAKRDFREHEQSRGRGGSASRPAPVAPSPQAGNRNILADRSAFLVKPKEPDPKPPACVAYVGHLMAAKQRARQLIHEQEEASRRR